MPAKDTYQKTEPDVLRYKNKVHDILKEFGVTAIFSFPEWLGGMTADQFKAKIVGSIRNGDFAKQTMYQARGQALCKLVSGSHWVALKVVGPNDSSLSFELSTSLEFKEVLPKDAKIDASIVEKMLVTLLDQMKKAAKDIASIRRAFIRT